MQRAASVVLQMSLDTKRAEIRKLEERARQREEALKKSEVRGGHMIVMG
jgi:hypothetical protein